MSFLLGARRISSVHRTVAHNRVSIAEIQPVRPHPDGISLEEATEGGGVGAGAHEVGGGLVVEVGAVEAEAVGAGGAEGVLEVVGVGPGAVGGEIAVVVVGVVLDRERVLLGGGVLVDLGVLDGAAGGLGIGRDRRRPGDDGGCGEAVAGSVVGVL